MHRLLLKIKTLWQLRSLWPYWLAKHWHEWRYRRNAKAGRCCRLRIMYLDRPTRTKFYPPGQLPKPPELGRSPEGYVIGWNVDYRTEEGA